MIIDYERNFPLYHSVHPKLKEGIAFLNSLKDKPVGRYEQGEMFAMVQEGVTGSVTEKKLEAHQNYIDVQYMVAGAEQMEWVNIRNLEIDTPYDAEKDIAFYKGDGASIKVQPGMFYIVFPEDGHKPCGHIEKETSYRKIVLKLRCEA